MKVLYPIENRNRKSRTVETYNKIMGDAIKLKGEYSDDIIFHCYWKGDLIDKHLLSIKSCYYFNVLNRKNRKIILWIDGEFEQNEVYDEINKYVEIREFDLKSLVKKTPFENVEWNFVTGDDKGLFTEYSNLYRLLLLYKHGGVWFDLDVVFLRNSDPLFVEFENEVCLYAWQPWRRNHPHPNNAVVFTTQIKSKKLEDAIFYINDRKKGFGFQRGKITYDLSIDFLVLPCYWFDPAWMGADHQGNFPSACAECRINNFFKSAAVDYTFENFYKGAFVYHWHGQWTRIPDDKSQLAQIYNRLCNLLEMR